MVSFQELYELVTGLIDIASGDVETAKVLSENRLLDKALYFIEQGSEKITKASYLSQCLCSHRISDEEVSRCYQNIAHDKKGKVPKPKDFVKRIEHNHLKLLKHMLIVNLKENFQLPYNESLFKVIVNLCKKYIIELLPLESHREVCDSILKPSIIRKLIILELAKNIESTLRKVCTSDILKSSKLCKSDMKSLEEKIKKCEWTKNTNEYLGLVDEIINVLKSLSEFLLVKEIWKQLKDLWNQPYVEKPLKIIYNEFKKLYNIINESIEEVMKGEEIMVSRERVQVVKQNIKFIVDCNTPVFISFLVAYMPFYLTSPFYNYIRYPDSPEKLNMCKDEALVEIEVIKNICNKKLIGPEDVVAEETYVKEFVEKAVENLKNAINILKEVLSSVKTLHSM